MKKIAIAIDGPAGSGKTTTARMVAERLGFVHIDTGAMYRALTLKVLRAGVPLEDRDRIRETAEKTRILLARRDGRNRVYLDGRDVTEDIRSQEVTRHVSLVSSYGEVREILVRLQRELAREGGVVLEGRDIGTVVLPDAELKIFLVASLPERARRRSRELAEAGRWMPLEDVERDLAERDRFDSTRAASPLQKAADAIELDTTPLTIEEQVAFVVQKARERMEEEE